MEELRHKAANTEEWNESYYFNFYDPRENIGGFTRIGFKPNKKEGVGYLFLFYKNEILSFSEQIEISDVPEKIQTGLLSFRPEWEFSFSGTMVNTRGNPNPVELHFTYSPVNKEFSYLECITDEEFEIAKVVSENHYEQIGIVTGSFKVGTEKYTISGFSERDHSWGERDWNAPELWIYVTAHFDATFGLNIAKMRIKGHEIDVGFIMKGKENIPVEEIQESTVYYGNTQKEFVYEVWDRNGDFYTLTGEVMKTVQIPYKKGDSVSILNENLSTFECEGKKGFGIAEYLVRIQ